MTRSFKKTKIDNTVAKCVHRLALDIRQFADHMCRLILQENIDDSENMLIFLEFNQSPAETCRSFLYLDEGILGFLAWPKVGSPADHGDVENVGTNVLLLTEGYQLDGFLYQPTFHEILIRKLQNVTSLSRSVLGLADFTKRKFLLLSSHELEQLHQGLGPREESDVERERSALDDLFMLAVQGVTSENGLFSAGVWRRPTDEEEAEEEEGDNGDRSQATSLARLINPHSFSATANFPAPTVTRDSSGRFCRPHE